jgi:hypothetical protein
VELHLSEFIPLLQQTRQAVWRVFETTYALVGFAKWPDSVNPAMPPAELANLLTKVAPPPLPCPESEIILREVLVQAEARAQAEAECHLASFLASLDGIGELIPDALLKEIEITAPQRLSGAGIKNSPPAKWVLRCALDIRDRIDQAAGLGNGAGRLTIAWGLVRESLAALDLPPKEDVADALEETFTCIARQEEQRALQEKIAATLAGQSQAGPATMVMPPCSAQFRFERVGRVWHLQFGTEKTEVPDSLSGLVYIARLLQRKHVSIPALQVEGHPAAVIPRVQHDAPAQDEQGKAYFQRRLHENAEAMKEVKDFEDQSEYQKLAQEREAIVVRLKADVGRGGKDRLVSGGNESVLAAGRVRKAIAEVRKQLRGHPYGMKGMAEHLKKHIGKEGNSFAYRPSKPEPDWAIAF